MEIRHAGPRSVEINCDILAAEADPTPGARSAGPAVSIQVRGTGVGIPASQLAAVFEPFVQVRADLTRPHEGTGLGLAISRDLALGMGGDLTAESMPGVGSTFTLTLAAVPPASHPQKVTLEFDEQVVVPVLHTL